MRQLWILILSVGLFGAEGNMSFAQSNSNSRHTEKTNLNDTSSRKDPRNKETASGSSTTTKPSDYGPFKGDGTSSDALTFHTSDYSELQLQRFDNQMYNGPYVPMPTTGTAALETVSTQTEAEFCLYCMLSQVQIPPINLNGSLQTSKGNGQLSGGIPLNSVTSFSNQTPDQAMKQAIKEMCDYVKKNPSCGPNKYAIVSDASRGSGNIRTAIIDISTCAADGSAKVEDMFPTGGGSGGIGNIPQSHATPPGFFKLTDSGLNTRKKWPTCSNGNTFNYFIMEGQGCKYNMPGESCQNTNARKREILYHTWPQVGASTWGCTGVPQDRFCSWGDRIKGSCLYNYIGK